MPNHFHLVVETPQPNLLAGIKWFLGIYTSRFNSDFVASGPAAQSFFGHLFCGRYKSLMADGSGSGYLKSVCDYVHLNPARSRRRGMLPADPPLKRFCLEQLAGVSAGPVEAPGVAAGGPVAGRVGHLQG